MELSLLDNLFRENLITEAEQKEIKEKYRKITNFYNFNLIFTEKMI